MGGDVVLPSQYFRNWQGDQMRKSAECQLLVAILGDAVECFQKHWGAADPAAQRLFRDAQSWIMESDACDPEGGELGFSFQYVCEVLSIEPDRVRTALQRWAENRERSAQFTATDQAG